MRGVALILTAVSVTPHLPRLHSWNSRHHQIKCAVQEWATGIHQNVNFDEDVYKSEYDVHFQDLARYETRSQDLKIVSSICQKLAEYGRQVHVDLYAEHTLTQTRRDHTKAPLVRDPAKGLPAEDFDRAIAAYRLRLQTS